MSDQYSLYVLELEPGDYENARWYVGITTDVQRRLYEHTEAGGPPKWTARNEVVDHAIIGEWDEHDARMYEDELTGILMHEYGYQSTRGGRYTNPSLQATPSQKPSTPSVELIEALATTDHGELSELGRQLSNGTTSDRDKSDSPRIIRRSSVSDGRHDVHQLFVYSDTATKEKEARRELEDRLGDVYKLDVREAIYLAGMENLDDAERILREWGADI